MRYVCAARVPGLLSLRVGLHCPSKEFLDGVRAWSPVQAFEAATPRERCSVACAFRIIWGLQILQKGSAG